jgi:hypothetical protein
MFEYHLEHTFEYGPATPRRAHQMFECSFEAQCPSRVSGEGRTKPRCGSDRKGIEMSVHVIPFAPTRSTRTPGSTPRTGQAPLRLTRRGRLVLVGAPLMFSTAALLAFVGFFTAPAMASGDSAEQTRTLQVSVSNGDSLWSLATEYAPERDPRDVVADIVELNNLDTATVPAGRQLYIPVAS